MPSKGDVIQLELSDAGDRDRCFGRLPSGISVFVRGRAVPGDVITATVTKAKKRFLEATLVSIVTPSLDRVEPPCPHFGPCGGCKWQNAKHSLQLQIKENRVGQALRRVGGIEEPPLQPMVAGDPFGYRNKLGLRVLYGQDDAQLAFLEPGSHAMLAITECHLASPAMLTLARQVLDLAVAADWRLTMITVRQSSKLNLGVHLEAETPPPAGMVLDSLVDGPLDVVKHAEGVHLVAPTMLIETFAGFEFEVPMRSFFQVNHAMAETIATRITEWAGPSPGKVIDLFCGVGAFTLPLAALAEDVLGLEGDRHAIRAARQNAARNKVGNCTFEVRDLNKGEALPKVDTLLLDPPRNGMSEDLMNAVLRADPTRIAYLSCDPGTFSRDIARLVAGGYRLESATPFDLFPQTDHVEVLGFLAKV